MPCMCTYKKQHWSWKLPDISLKPSLYVLEFYVTITQDYMYGWVASHQWQLHHPAASGQCRGHSGLQSGQQGFQRPVVTQPSTHLQCISRPRHHPHPWQPWPLYPQQLQSDEANPIHPKQPSHRPASCLPPQAEPKDWLEYRHQLLRGVSTAPPQQQPPPHHRAAEPGSDLY